MLVSRILTSFEAVEETLEICPTPLLFNYSQVTSERREFYLKKRNKHLYSYHAKFIIFREQYCRFRNY
jgi:hypothetical protein